MSLPRTLLRHRHIHPLRAHAHPPLLLHRHLATAPPPPGGEEPFTELDAGADRDPAPPRLARPIGLDHPPRPDENTGVDTRTWAERRDDFRNWDKHLEKRAKMTQQISKPYFRDLTRLSATHKGKSFLAPALLFRADKALFFPNLVGRTLLHPADPLQHTTGALAGKISVVSIFSSAWAEAQARTFTAGLDSDDDGVWGGGGDGDGDGDGGVQRVDVNVETNPLRAWLVRLFVPRIRAAVPEGVWARYFLVQRGLGDEVRERMAYVNAKVGYVYLVDWECRIRWAGSGRAGAEERAALRRGVARLREEWARVGGEWESVRAEREARETERRRALEEMDEI